MSGNLDGVTCLMDHSPCAGSPLAAAAQEAAGDQDEAQHCPHHQGDVPPTKVGDGAGVKLVYSGGGEHERVIHWTRSGKLRNCFDS